MLLLFGAIALLDRTGTSITGFATVEKTFTATLDTKITANAEVPITLEAEHRKTRDVE
ncbi:hypothetical protein HYU17_05180 [Candidatus Woesearchaeota archaeon]|nr:hypothetical protein [Candidatus Woesearchaeota archaeon]